MAIKEIFDKLRSRNEIYKEVEAQDRAESRVAENKLSSNERALRKILRREREDMIRKELARKHKQMEKEYWHKDVISQKNLFKGKCTILNQKNLFQNKSNLFKRRHK